MKRLMIAAMLACASIAQAAWPDRPVRIVAPDAPGGGGDIIARVLGDELGKIFGQPFPVENRPGAGGRIALENVAHSAPDGYTLLVGNAGSNGINGAIYRDLPYDTVNAFTPISQIVQGPNILVVNRTELPVATVAELIAYAKAHPGELNYGSGGPGSSAHLSMELFKQRAGIDMQHVPFRGASPMTLAVVQGETPVAFMNLSNVLPLIRRGEVTPIAVTSLQRWHDVPDVPTVDESGLKGFETIAWNGLLAPAGLPREIVDKLHAAVVKIAQEPNLKEKAELLGNEVVASTPEEFAARIRADVAKWRALVDATGLRLD